MVDDVFVIRSVLSFLLVSFIGFSITSLLYLRLHKRKPSTHWIHDWDRASIWYLRIAGFIFAIVFVLKTFFVLDETGMHFEFPRRAVIYIISLLLLCSVSIGTILLWRDGWLKQPRVRMLATVLLLVSMFPVYAELIVVITSIHRDFVPEGAGSIDSPWVAWIAAFAVKMGVYFTLVTAIFWARRELRSARNPDHEDLLDNEHV